MPRSKDQRKVKARKRSVKATLKTNKNHGIPKTVRKENVQKSNTSEEFFRKMESILKGIHEKRTDAME